MLRVMKKIGILVLAVTFTLPRFAFASSLTSVSDYMTSQTISVASNHEIAFVTPTGVIEGSTIIITFASSFDTSTITEDDVDVEVAGTDRTTATSCSGTEQMSVAMTSDVLTITVCAGDGGVIIASGSVVVKVGANAAESGSGSNRITNPSSVGTYTISISGTFGDFGSIGQTIITTSSGSLTAVVPNTSSGSGTGGGSSTSTTETPDTETTDTDTSDTVTPDVETPDTETPDTDTSDTDTSDTVTPDTDTTETTDSETESGDADSDFGTETPSDSGSADTSGTSSSPDTTTGSESGSGGTPEEEIIPESGSGLPEEEVSWIVEDGGITLESEDDTIVVIPDRILTIIIPEEALEKEAESVTITIDSSTYTLIISEDGDYETALVTPDASGTYQAVITITYSDGTTQTISTMLDVVDLGYVYEMVDGEKLRVDGAIITLYESRYGEWVQIDTTTTDASGTFGWYVENGIYRVGAEKEGYQQAISDAFSVSSNIVTATFEIEPLPEPIDEILASDASTMEKVIAIVGSLVERAEIFLDTLRDHEAVQDAVDVVTPVVITLTVTSGILLWNIFNLAPLLQYIFSSPLLLVGRRKRKGWGVVYHAGIKLPVDLAIVRLFRFPEMSLVATRVTDKKGRYFFLAQPGDYRLEVTKSGFSFPSQITTGLKEDGQYLDLYQGQTIQVTDRDATIVANIPLDPTGVVDAGEFVKFHRFRLARRLQMFISTLGLFGALFILIIEPGWLTLIGLTVQIVLYGLFRRLATPRKPKNWGIVYDQITHHPLANAIVRIFEPKYNKLLETAVTDTRGRYSFLVGANEYYTTYDRDAYHPVEVRPLDLRGEKEAREVAIDVGMQKKQEV
ncbi:MAG: hypothetical protein AAB337_02505 [Patescibacteria group bacterium]